MIGARKHNYDLSTSQRLEPVIVVNPMMRNDHIFLFEGENNDRLQRRQKKEDVIHDSLGKSGSIVAKGMPPVREGDSINSDVKMSLEVRHLEVLTNGLSLKIELFTCRYLPGRIILD